MMMIILGCIHQCACQQTVAFKNVQLESIVKPDKVTVVSMHLMSAKPCIKENGSMLTSTRTG